MTDEITVASVDQAAAKVADLKEQYYANTADEALKAEYQDAKRELAAVRSAWRAQEEAAGRRQPNMPGGDAEEV